MTQPSMPFTTNSMPQLKSDIKILFSDFNAKVGREGIFGPTVGKHSLKSSDNGLRQVSFAVAQNMVISSTRFQHRNVLAVP